MQTYEHLAGARAVRHVADARVASQRPSPRRRVRSSTAVTRWAKLAVLVGCVGCDVVTGGGGGGGGGGLGPATEGSRRLVAEVQGPIAMTFRAGGYLGTLRASIPVTGDAGPGVQAFVESHSELFGLDASDHTVAVAGTRDLLDAEVVTLKADYRGVPIEGGFIVALVRTGALEYLASYLPAPSPIDVTPVMSEAEVRASLDRYFGMSTTLGPPELVVMDAASFVGASSLSPGRAELAWRVELEVPEAATVWVADADGKLLALSSHRQTASRTVYDGQGRATVSEALASMPAATEATGLSATASADAAAAFEHLATARDYYAGRLGWLGYDGQDRQPLRAVVNVKPELDDMMRLVHNAWWDAEEGAFVFTAGMAVPDATVHEFTHAVIDYASPNSPTYQYVPGAIEEALCDSFAAFATPGANQWVVGEGSASGLMIAGLPDGAGRSMSDPSIAGDPAHLDEFTTTTAGICDPSVDRCPNLHTCIDGRCVCTGGEGCDQGGVHRNSGIANQVVYLAAVGGRHATHAGPPLDGIGVGKLEQILFASTYLLSDSTRFRSWRDDVVTACQLFATLGVSFPSADAITWSDCGRVINAFAAAGIGPRDRDEDSWDDDVDVCPSTYNPEQAEGDDCITDPWQHCRAFQYERAFDDFLAGNDIGFPRNATDAKIMTAQCAFVKRDYSTSEGIAVDAARGSSRGAAATAWYVAEYAAARRGHVADAEGYHANGIAASLRSGMCSGLTGDEAMACAEGQGAGIRGSLDRLEADF